MLHKLNGQNQRTSLLISAPLKMGKGDFTAAATAPISPKVDRGVFLKSFLRAKPDHRDRKTERLSCFALVPSLDRASRFIPESLTAEYRLPTQADGAARSEFDRAARSLRRPRPCHPRPQLLLNSTTLDRLGALAVFLRSEKRWFKNPIHGEER